MSWDGKILASGGCNVLNNQAEARDRQLKMTLPTTGSYENGVRRKGHFTVMGLSNAGGTNIAEHSSHLALRTAR